MKPMLVIGVLLILLGGVALAYQGFTYTDKEKVIDVGPIEASAEHKKTVHIPPILGGLILAVGVVLTVAGMKGRSAHA